MNYLYNGIMAPTLPERDEEKYPYVIVGGSNPENPSPGSPIEMHAFSDPTLYQGALFSPYIKCEPSGNYFYAYVYEGEWKVHTPANTDVVSFTDNIRWTNVDLYNPDGTLFLAASDPVPVIEVTIPRKVDRYSYIVGFNLGLAGMAYPYSAPAPVAYLYNGIRLPALPEWDRERFPYVCIYHPRKVYGDKENVETEYDFDSYEAIITDCEMVYVKLNGRIWYTIDGVLEDCNYCQTRLKKDGEIVGFSEWTDPYHFTGISAIPVWCNHTILNETDLPCPEPSKPVPVYE